MWRVGLIAALCFAGCLEDGGDPPPPENEVAETPPRFRDPRPDDPEAAREPEPEPPAQVEPDPVEPEPVEPEPVEPEPVEPEPVEPEPVEPEPVEPEPVEPDPVDADCGVCGDILSQTVILACTQLCDVLHRVWVPSAVTEWKACVADRHDPYGCMDAPTCAAEDLIASHCDGLARCFNDGRGWFDEAACREDPYSEPQRWACLRPARRVAVDGCLRNGVCNSMEQCVSSAICQGDADCMRTISARLAVDCDSVCGARGAICAANPDALVTCLRSCRLAADLLADDQRRTFESCGLQEGCAEPGVDRATTCIAELACENAGLQAAAEIGLERCGAPAPGPRWGCLGRVSQMAINQCYTESPCEEVAACLGAATCAGEAGCEQLLGAPPPGAP